MSDTNATRSEGVDVCLYCRRPAAYFDARINGTDEVFCEPCARRESGRDAGLVVAGLNALETALQILGEAERDVSICPTCGRLEMAREQAGAPPIPPPDWPLSPDELGREYAALARMD